MAKNKFTEEIRWKDRKHWAWFPFSFTVYKLTTDRLYVQTGFLNTHYDETLLYRIVDICLSRTLAQKVFGTGTITLSLKADTQGSIVLKNIKNPMEVNRMLSLAIEESRNQRGVVGREFYTNDPVAHDGEEAPAPEEAPAEGYDFDGDQH
ncbi:MAG: PH domain-containing protein [Lachnospiraceae bacterium]|nr:PH domain-containing protein [Lachnospiraceae bacterium]